MAFLSKVSNMLSDRLAAWTNLQEHGQYGQYLLQLVKANPWTTVGIGAVTAIAWSYIRAPRNLPPGPRGLPLLGATSCLVEGASPKMLEWKRNYGDIMSFYLMGDLNVMLNSENVIREAFVKRGEEFAHRHKVVEMFGGISYGDEIFSAPFNETWKKNKKFAMLALKAYGFGTERSEGKVHDMIQILQDKLIKTNGSPVNLNDDLKALQAGVIYSIIMGQTSPDDQDMAEALRLVTNWMTSMNDMMIAKGFIGMIFPRLMGFIVRNLTKAYKKDLDVLLDFLAAQIDKKAVDYVDREADCVVDVYLNDRGSDPEVVKVMAGTILGFLPDALETATIFELWILLYIIYHPDVQKRLRDEIHAVCGTSRLPKLNDRAEMPYTQGVIHEVLRLVMLTPTSMPRVLVEDTKLEGFDLPKGTVVAANYYAIHYDPAIFPDPNKFNPARFITDDGKFNTSLAGKVMTFGVGTRRCVGEAFFKVQMFFLCVRLLQQFHLEFDPDAPKPTLEKDPQHMMGAPCPFKVCFKPI